MWFSRHLYYDTLLGMSTTLGPRAIVYCRISSDRADSTGAVQGLGVADQERDARARAKRLGWTVARVVIENDVSAFKRRRVTLPDGTRALRVIRPGFRSALDDLVAGRANALIAHDLDRAVRDPRDLEDLIDVVEQHQVTVESVTGSLRLSNDADITMARVLVAVANKASRDTGRRVSRARLRTAEAGGFNGGKRPFGFERDGVTVRAAEAAEIVTASRAVLSGVPLREIAADLRQRNVPTTQGGPWTTASLRAILRRPRNAGLMVHKGEQLGEEATAQWAPIVPADVLAAVRGRLADPARLTSPGNTPRWLGSGIYRCACGGPMRVHGQGRYRCSLVAIGGAGGTGHSTIAALAVDSMVERAVIGRLSLPDAIELVAREDASDGVDVRAVRAESKALRLRLDQAAEDFADGTISRSQLAAITKRVNTKLDELNATLATATSVSPLADVVGAGDVADAWSRAPLGTRRAIVAAFVQVCIARAVPGSKGFDPSRVQITWVTSQRVAAPQS